MNNKKVFTLEHSLYLLALGLALAVRLIGLGDLPFNENEANWAWQAYQVAHAEPVQISSQPAYVLLTGTLFFLLSSSEFLARFLPALFGALVPLLPYVFRQKIGRKAALAAAFGLALDPLMVAVSRQAGSPMLAVSLLVLVVIAWQYRKPGICGVFTALLLLSGLPAVTVVIGLLVFALLMRLSGQRLAWLEAPQFEAKPFWSALGVTLVAAGTLFMRYPMGLSAMLQAVPDYLVGWSAGETPFLQLLAALPIYQPIGFFFAVIVVLKAENWQKETIRAMIVFALTLLVVVAIYPSRQVRDLVWVLPVLWLVGGYALGLQLKPVEKEERVLVWAQAVVILSLAVFWWANLVKTTRAYFINIPEGFKVVDFSTLDAVTRDYLGRMAVVIGIPIVIALLVLIVYSNWSKRIAFAGSFRGVGIFVGFYVISVLFGLTDMRPKQANELWSLSPAPGYADDLRQALGEMSVPVTGNRNEIEVVYQLDMALLHWQLRDMPNARYVPVLSPEDSPAVIINNSFSLDEPGRSTAYRGEKIALQLERNWGNGVLPADFDRWFVFREGLVEKQWVVLWARADIFVGYEDLQDEMNGESGEPVE